MDRNSLVTQYLKKAKEHNDMEERVKKRIVLLYFSSLSAK